MNVPRGTASRLRRLQLLVREEAQRQNLVSASTLSAIYRRHTADSLQLVPLLKSGSILDVGSGAGFPGLAIACVIERPTVLVEPRRLRARFLLHAVEELGLHHVTVFSDRVERVAAPPIDNITARAVMNLDAIFRAGTHLSHAGTRWVLPKGRSAQSELATARLSWQGRFELVPSRTDADAQIVVAEAVRRREG